MSFEIDEKNSSNSMIVKDILNEFPLDKSEIKEEPKEGGGIPLSRVVDLNKHEKILPILKCKICLNILLNPYDCSKCGNTFCYKCINKLRESMVKCPFGCIDYEIMPSSFAIKKFLEQLKFTCLNKDNGCNEIIPYNNLEQHDKNCSYINSICPNSQCGLKVPWNLLKNHLQNECMYTLFECPNCHLKLNRKEYPTHNKICSMINKEFDKQSPIVNKLTKEDIQKNNEIFNNVMNGIENLPSFINENTNDNNNNINNNSLNILIKSLIFGLSGRISMIENQMSQINKTLQQFSESNLVFYQSINDELDSINEKIANLNENSRDNNKINNLANKFNSTCASEMFEFNSPINQNNSKEHRKTIFPQTSRNRNANEKYLTVNTNTKNTERQGSTKGFDKFKTSQRDLINNSVNKKISSKFELNDHNSNINNTINISEFRDKNKNKNNIKKGTTLNNLRTKEKFIKEMRSTKYMEKIKGIQPKKQNYIFPTFSNEDRLIDNSNTNTNTNIINEQSNNYLISNNFNTINGSSYINSNKINAKTFSGKTLSNNNHKNINIREKIFKENKNNENAFDYIFTNQEIILDKIQNLEKVMLNVGNQKENSSNNDIMNSFNSHKISIPSGNNNSMKEESPKSNIQNQS